MDHSLGDQAAHSPDRVSGISQSLHPDGKVNPGSESESSKQKLTINNENDTQANTAVASDANFKKLELSSRDVTEEQVHSAIDPSSSDNSQPIHIQNVAADQMNRDETRVDTRSVHEEHREETTNSERQRSAELPQIPTGNNRRRFHRFTPRDRHGVFMNYLFVNLTLRYITYFKATTRRLIEFFVLLNAFLMFAVLVYIHVAFVRSSGDCLNHVRDIWPQSGILRVQISYNKSDPSHQLLWVKNDIPASVVFQSTPYNAMVKFALPILPKDLNNYLAWKQLVLNQAENSSEINNEQGVCRNENKINMYRMLHLLQDQCPVLKYEYIEDLKESFSSILSSLVANMYVEYRNPDETSKVIDETAQGILSSSQKILSEILQYDPFEPPPVRDYYAIEYSTEFGFLRLSPSMRIKLGIPTLLVNLNPDVHTCFGGNLKKFMLETFLGYDDFLMTSIKKLAENGKSQGYLRNCVTGEYFRFVTVWVNHTSGIIAFAIMVIFTLIVSMLLRYSYHQIFMFMMNILRVLDTDIRLVFPVAPMLTIVLALVGMEEIMTEFFHDSTVAFYVILLIWSADQFDVICLHTVIGRRHWVRFFFLYHFAFYIYNYKFNGQYSKLALFTSWLFIIHSMVYFFHHYEIPSIQRQLMFINQRNRFNNRNPPNEPDNFISSRRNETAQPHREAPSNVVHANSSDQNDNRHQQSGLRDLNRSPDERNRIDLLRCQFSTFFYIFLPYACTFVYVLIAASLTAIIFSHLSYAKQNLAIVPLMT